MLSSHQFEAAFPLPASEEKTIKEKNQCILKHKKQNRNSIATTGTIFSAG